MRYIPEWISNYRHIEIGAAAPQIFANVDFLPIDNNNDKKKIAKKSKLVQIP